MAERLWRLPTAKRAGITTEFDDRIESRKAPTIYHWHGGIGRTATRPLLRALESAELDDWEPRPTRLRRVAATDRQADQSDSTEIRAALGRSDVLVVEDEPMLRRIVAEALQDAGYRVVSAATGTEALHLLDTRRPWIVLLDLSLPGMNGADFAREARARHVSAKVLVVSAAPNAESEAEHIEADGYLKKPFEIDDLLDAVAQYRPH